MPDQTPPFNPFDDDDDEPGYCATCCNTGEVDCYCGGDLCVCTRETLPCPDCPDTEPDPDRLREDRDERVRLAKEIPDDE